MKRIIISSLFMALLCWTFSATAGKKQCQDYRKKLDNIQAQQRQSNTRQRSQHLSSLEVKARDTWWQCQTGKLKPTLTKKRKTKQKKSNKNNKVNAARTNAKEVLVPFASSGPIIVRSKYQGEKLQAWLQFYQAKKMCARPKTTQQFAACVEDKRRQQIEFEKGY